MNLRSIKSAVCLLSVLPLVAFAEETPKKEAETFQEICTGSWMKRVDEVSDKVSYKSFGEKYCACALTQPLDTDAAVDKAIKLCISRTILEEGMNTLSSKVGLDKATDADISQYCMDKWNLIYPKITEPAKQTATAFCNCSQPKLVELLKNKAIVKTEKEQATQIDSIAETCSATIKTDNPSTKPAN